MNTKELQNILIGQISQIEDPSFLQAIKIILDSKSEKKQILKLSLETRNEIVASQEEVKKGLFIENDQLSGEIEKWLSEE
ncbi:hypothetical protein [Reichenbachiella sp. MALMAid0571]|uniref:hypothetical protein n=1 Tax=Reichenbachiella sp. MALMAid0571 TaxID=3143939 RepID=UPI0032DE554E